MYLCGRQRTRYHRQRQETYLRTFLSSATNFGKTGSGIGLHIANEYVHLHKGTISVTDNFPKGSVFTVKLPIVTYASEKEELLPELLNNDKAPNELPVPNAEELRYTILLVDDNKDFCSFMSEYLSDEYAIQVAYNGAEALKILEKTVSIL